MSDIRISFKRFLNAVLNRKKNLGKNEIKTIFFLTSESQLKICRFTM